MNYRVDAQQILTGWQVQLTTSEATPDGWHWEHLVLEFVHSPSWELQEPWDVVWFLGQFLQERALERGVVVDDQA